MLKRAIIKPHRTVITSKEMEEERKKLIKETFIKMLREEMFPTSRGGTNLSGQGCPLGHPRV
ncbi:MAG: hypothetical protein QW294_04740 [Candidatus Bathyarchaeia archaeon]